MSVISNSHVNLVRARKALEHAFAERDWAAVKASDKILSKSLNIAFEDEQRNAAELVQEMEKVLHAYAGMLDVLPQAALATLSTFPSV